MTVILSWLYSWLFQLVSYVMPYFAHFEVRVHLNHLQLLLLMSCQIISGETYSIKYRKDNQSDVILLHFFSDSVDKICFSSGLGQILEISRLYLIFLLFFRNQRFCSIYNYSLLILDPIFLILLTVNPDHELSCIHHRFLAVPLQKLFDCFSVLCQEWYTWQSHFSMNIVANFNEFQKIEQALITEEPFLRSTTSQNCIP